MENLDMKLNDSEIKVDLIVIGEPLEAVALRSVLESFGVEVRCHFIGHVKRLVSFLNAEEFLYKVVILSCHGDERGIILPELAAELDKTMPYQGVLSASNCREFVRLKHQVVINTGCCLGKDDFADSFIKNGASAYIGFEDYPEGNAVVFFIISFLYFYLYKRLPLNEAFAKARSIDKETSMAKLHLIL